MFDKIVNDYNKMVSGKHNFNLIEINDLRYTILELYKYRRSELRKWNCKIKEWLELHECRVADNGDCYIVTI